MRIKMKIILAFLTIILLNSCNKEEEKYEEYFDTYRDILIAREFSKDSLEANRKIDSILTSKNLSEPEFRSLMFDLIKDREEYFVRLQKLRDSIKHQKELLIKE